MNNSSPRQLALLAASCITLITFTAIVVATAVGGTPRWTIALFTAAATFITAYLITRFLIRRFIQNRIQVIYRTIRSMKFDSGSESMPLFSDREDTISLAQRDVLDWARNQATELENLKKLESYRRDFLANVSHELKTPIFNIQGYIMTLLDGGLEDESINRNYLQRAEKSVDRMINIIDDLEAISRLESGELNLDKSVYDIVEQVRDVFEAQEMNSARRKITLKFRDENKRPIRVNADKHLIRQVLTNLVVNSVKYGKEGGTTEVRFYDMDENILVEVADNGLGIAKEHLPRLFERFYRVDKGRSREQGGTGLGLAIVKHIIEAHGQTVNVRSTEGIGSTFAFTLKKA